MEEKDDIDKYIISLTEGEESVDMSYKGRKFRLDSDLCHSIYNSTSAQVLVQKWVLLSLSDRAFRAVIGISSYKLRNLVVPIDLYSNHKDILLKEHNQVEEMNILEATAKSELMIKFFVDKI